MNKNEQPVCQTDEKGNKYWYLNDQLHRIDGPAIEHADGSRTWFVNGQRHRENGPAMESSNGSKGWWYHGKPIYCFSQEEFERLIKLIFLF